jgi:RsiW-degrading membrane proteinase PrsW (M82 family)
VRLRVVEGDRAGEAFPLTPGDTVLLGRGHEVHFRFEDPHVSRVHAELVVQQDGAVILTNRSQHGTFFRGHRMDTCQLRPGDELTIGSTRLLLEDAPLKPAIARVVAAPPMVPVTPAATPGAVAPDAAGYDSKGIFHAGYTLMGEALAKEEGSSVFQVPLAGAKVRGRTLLFFFFVVASALLGSLVLYAVVVRPMIQNSLGQFLLACSLALLPTIPYLFAYKFLDRNAQIPMRNYLACFLWGATVGCGASVILNSITSLIFEALTNANGASALTAVLAAPFFEETTKGLAIFAVFLILRDEFDNAVEGLILGAASGLGFALIENCVYDARFLAQGMTIQDFLWNGTYRTLTCALVGHPVYTAMTGLGFGLAREVRRTNPMRYVFPFLGWFMAMLLHAGWNLSTILVPGIMGTGRRADVTLAVLFGGGCALFFLAVLFFALAKERRILLQQLGSEVEKGFIEPAELESFKSLWGRERFVFAGLRDGTWSLRKELRRAQLQLAFRKWHLEQGDVMKGFTVDRGLLEARNRIRDARNAINAKLGRFRA